MSTALPDRAALPDEVDGLKDLVLETMRRAQVAAQDAASVIERLQLQLAVLRRQVFGVRSEQSPGQGELFSEQVDLPMPPACPQCITYERQRRGRPALPADLPRVRIEYTLDAAECAAFARVKPIGEEVSETLEYTPARLVVIEHARLKYRCEHGDGRSTIRTASAWPSPLPRSNAGPGLLAHILVSKYVDGLPLARLERQFARHGLRLSRKTLCDWVLAACQLLGCLRGPLHQHILGAPVVFSDDTTVRLMTRAVKGKTVTARLWAYVSAGSVREGAGNWKDYPKAVLYEFTRDRGGKHPMKALARYRGYLQADDYAGYHGLFRGKRIYHVACWAHARRAFYDMARTAPTPGLAQDALNWIGQIYGIEREIRGRSPPERARQRQQRTRPILRQFRRWLQGIEPDLLPQGPMAVGVRYVLSNWRALTRFTRVGMLETDTNLVERCMRPIAVGRKAWLFVGSDRGGEAAATVLSLIESCKLNGIEPYAYLKDVLARIGGHRQDRLAELLPFNWKPLAAATTV